MLRLKSILTIILLAVTSLVTAQEYFIDSVCVGAERFYRIDGEKGSTYDWHIINTITNIEEAVAPSEETPFTDIIAPGDTVWGSEIVHYWTKEGIYRITTYHYSAFGCDTLEQGLVKVFEGPEAFAGTGSTVCFAEQITLTDDDAQNYSSLEWITRGDGTFDVTDELHPVYTPGPGDSITGSVTLVITAYGLAENGSCIPAVDSVTYLFNNPQITFTPVNLLCFRDSIGSVTAAVNNGTPPYSYAWKGPGAFASTNDAIYELGAGMYVLTVTDANGCAVTDSIEITEPEELLAEISADVLESCPADTIHLTSTVTGGTGAYSHKWTGDGAAYLNYIDVANPVFRGAPAGSYELIYTVTDANNCTDTKTIDLLIIPETLSSVDTLLCAGDLPILWHDSTYTAFGTYTNIIDNADGCDSVITFNIIEMPATTGTFDTLMCAGELPLVWHDSTYTDFGTYTNTIDNADGCDSIISLTIIEAPATTSTYDTLLCAGELPIIWHDSTYTAFGTYTNVIDNFEGCDSVITFTIIEAPATAGTFDTLMCAGELPLVWHDSTYTDFGTYTNTIDNADGCDSIISLTIIEAPATTSTYDTLLCAGELPVIWHDSTYTAFGTYTNVIDNFEGCDSVITFTIIEAPATAGTFDTLMCAGELPLVWHDSTYTDFGTYTNTIDNADGCDSIISLTIIEAPATTSTYDTLLCAGELPVIWHDSTYTAFGTYTNVIDNFEGCDSIITFTIIETPATAGTFDTLMCAGELPLVWHDSTYTDFGTYTNTIDNADGCDSIISLTIIEAPATTSIFDTLMCAGELPLVWHDSTYTDFGIYTNTIDNADGCDSIITLTIIEAPATTSIFDTLMCAGELPLVWHDSTYTDFGTYTNTIDNADGCDSIISLTIIEAPATAGTFDTLMCAGELPLVWHDSTYTDFGTYTNTIDNADGCDSIISLTIIEAPATTSIFDTLMCAGELPLVWHDSTYTDFGTYTNTIDNADGCDSIISLTIIEAPATTSIFDTLMCAGELPLVWHDSTYTDFGTYTNTIDNADGCDSIITLTIIEAPATTGTYDTLLCAGELPVIWHDSTYTAFGTYTNVIDNSEGCDSVITFTIIEAPEILVTEQITICENELPYTWYGETFNTADTIIQNVPSTGTGCDTVRTLQVITTPEILVTQQITICENELPYTWYGETFNTADTIIQNVPSTGTGCDTVRTLQVITTPEILVTQQITICENELPYTWYGETFNTADTIIQNVPSAGTGCDTVRTLQVITTPEILVTEQITICENELPYTWYGETFNTADTIVQNVSSTGTGCDTVRTLQVITTPEILVTEQITICENELPYTWYGETFNTADTIIQNVPSTGTGCDTVRPAGDYYSGNFGNEQITICENELPYTWYGETFNTADTIIQNVPSAGTGCDTVRTLQVITTPEILVTEQITICENELPYTWYGETFNTADTIVQNVPSAGTGCDTVRTLQVITTPEILVTEQITICENELPYTWYGETFNTADTIIQNVPSTGTGCDTIRTLQLQVVPEILASADTTLCENELPFTWNGQNVDAAGDYTAALTSTAGCDSTLTLTVTVVNNILASADTTVCENELPFTWNGQNVDAAGDYTAALTSTAGCDSTLTLTVTVVNNILASADTTVCENELPFTWNGQNVDAAGDYTAALTSTAGCDSTLTLTVTVVNNILASADTTECENELPFTWNGQNVDAAGDYTAALTSAAGCDSTITLTVTVVNNILASADTTVCENELPFTWNGQSVDAAGDYTAALSSAAGCDSTVTLTVNVNNNILASLDTTVCENQIPFTWNGQDVNAPGDYTADLTSAAGCDSTLTLTVTVVNNILASADTTVCENELPFTWNGQSVDAAGDYTAALTSAAGCDSTLTLTVTVVNNILASADTTVCENELPFTWNGQSVDAAGDYTAALSSAAGCDSTVTLTVNVNNNILASLDTTVCENQIPFTWNGQDVNAPGDYTADLTSAAGCDSTLTLTVTVVNNILASADTTVCENELPFTWNGQSVDAAGDYTAALTSAAGCDSTLTLTVTVVNNILASADTTVCENELPFTWNGQNVDAAGDYTAALTSAAGCDSTLTLTVTVVNNILASADTTVCENELPFTWNGQSVDAAGDYTAALSSAAGCDSTVTLTVNVNNNILASLDTTVCENQIPFTWNGQDVNAPGDYTADLTSAAGCDSTLTLTVTVVNNILASADTTVCENELPFTWNGQSVDAAGDYTAALTSAAGCDSTVTLTVNVNNNILASLDTTVCENQIPFTWNGQDVNAPGDYTADLTSAAGCDSTVTLTVRIENNTFASVDSIVCENEIPFMWNGINVTAAGDYTADLQNSAGCDSTVTMTVNVINNVVASIDTLVCENEIPFIWKGQNINGAGDYSAALNSSSGCDSTISLTVNVINNVVVSTDTTVCENQIPFDWNGQNITAAGDYSVTFASAAGCDSTVTLTVNVDNNIVSTMDTTICENELPFTWKGQDVNAAGDYSILLNTAAGCDSTVVLKVNVLNNITISTDTIVCENQVPFYWNSQDIDVAGVYTAYLISAAGCDSTVKLTVTIDQYQIKTEDITVCENELPFVWNGKPYDTAGTYTDTVSALAGCDTIATLNLIIDQYQTKILDITVCENEVPYLWNGKQYNAAGSYIDTISAVTGCDTIATLNLNIDEYQTKILDVTVCLSELPYILYGKSYTAEGSYTDTIPAIAGCDTILTFNLLTDSLITPLFDILGPYEPGSAPPPLPLASLNGISGTWSPDIISTESVGFITYTFTPDPGECAVPIDVEIEVIAVNPPKMRIHA